MIQQQTMLRVGDNTGAKKLMCIRCWEARTGVMPLLEMLLLPLSRKQVRAGW